jgi:hypothetical protein
MSRQRFEQWILNEAELDSTQKRELEAELARDPELAEFREGLLSIEQIFRSAALAEPKSGFVGRWKKLMRQEPVKAARKQNLTLLSALSIVGILSFVGATILLFSSPAELASSILKTIVEMRAQFEFAWNFLTAMADAIPGMVGVLMISGLVAALGWLSVAWITSLYRFAYLERRNGV